MNKYKLRYWILTLAIAGVLFSGYLSWKFSQGVCNGGCALLWGQPTCLYGLIMFALILLGAIGAFWCVYALWMSAVVAGVGVLFSLYWSIVELRACIFCYWLGFPNCVYGLLVYIAVLVLCMVALCAYPKRAIKK